MKKTVKKTKKMEVEIGLPPVGTGHPPVLKEPIAETSTDFNGEALVGLANKVNEIIRYLNK